MSRRPRAPTTLTNREDAPEWVWALQWRHLFGTKTFIEVKYNGWMGFYDLNPEVNEPGIFDGSTGAVLPVAGLVLYYADRNRNQVNASISHYAEAFGKHDLKFGVEIERSKVRAATGIWTSTTTTTPSTTRASSTWPTPTPTTSAATTSASPCSPRTPGTSTDRLTINAGVRFDWVRGYPAYESAKGSIGDSKVYDVKNWAPRLGFAYDLTGDRKTVLKGSYSQYYEAPSSWRTARRSPASRTTSSTPTIPPVRSAARRGTASPRPTARPPALQDRPEHQAPAGGRVDSRLRARAASRTFAWP